MTLKKVRDSREIRGYCTVSGGASRLFGVSGHGQKWRCRFNDTRHSPAFQTRLFLREARTWWAPLISANCAASVE